MVAPGDGEAEPGVTATNLREPAKLATEGIRDMKDLGQICFPRFICRPLRGLGPMLGSVPQARLRRRLGLALFPPASQAG